MAIPKPVRRIGSLVLAPFRAAAFCRRALANRTAIEAFLYFNAGTQAPGGTVDSAEFQGLVTLANQAAAHPGPIIEIGTLFGYSTQALALGKRADQPLLAVDNYSWNPIGIPQWRHQELTAKNLTYLARTQNVRLEVCSNADFYARYNGPAPAMVFIDAGHDYTQASIDIGWARKVGAAIICGDDYSWPGVAKAVEEAFGKNYHLVGDMWVANQPGQSA